MLPFDEVIMFWGIPSVGSVRLHNDTEIFIFKLNHMILIYYSIKALSMFRSVDVLTRNLNNILRGISQITI